jgi:2-polyprenyl-3-methyl-5-hydroxy-6-metoxy-1,4-benzoquinol methylase
MVLEHLHKMNDYTELTKLYDQRGINYFTPAHLTIPFIKQSIVTPVTRILSLGCGDGRILKEVTHLSLQKIVGVDISSVRIAHAKETVPNAVFYCQEVSSFLKSCVDQFGAVFIFEVLEHLIDDLEVWELIPKVCPNGFILGSVPINIPDPAHLRDFANVQEISNRYRLTDYRILEKHVYFKHNIRNGTYG